MTAARRPRARVSRRGRQRHRLAFLAPLETRRPRATADHDTADRLRQFFVGSLVTASLCKKHRVANSLLDRPLTAKQSVRSNGVQCSLHTISWKRQQAFVSHDGFSKEDAHSMLDYYDGPKEKIPEVSTTGTTAFTTNTEVVRPPDTISNDVAVGQKIGEETVAKLARRLDSIDSSPEEIFGLYRSLPSPGVSHLNENQIRLLLRRMSVVENKSERAMLRYLSIVDDMKLCKLPLVQAEWNSAISFAGRCFSRISRAEVGSALYIWREMEQDAGVKGNHVTFNILFDIAVKAGKFVLADLALKEMKARGIDMQRYGRMGQLYYQGSKGNGEGIRTAYRDLVEQGEVVDTAVINCVMASLIRAGEGPSAQLVYERMRWFQEKHGRGPRPPEEWTSRRKLGKYHQWASNMARQGTFENQHQIQEKAPLAPDLRTYRILIKYHALNTGDLQQIRFLLEDMQDFDVLPDGSIFLLLFQGFATQGGVRFTPWNHSALEEVWETFNVAAKRGTKRVYHGKFVALWSLRAFMKCLGEEKTMDAWEVIRSQWQLREDEVLVVKGVLAELVGH